MPEDFNSLSDDQLRELVAQKMAKEQTQPSQPQGIDFNSMSDDQLRELAIQKMLQEQAKQAPPTPQPMTDQVDQLRAARVGVERGVTFGARPFISGLGAAAGAGVGTLQQGRTLREAIAEASQAFKDARGEAIEEEAALSKEFPGTMAVGEIGGAVLTAPLTPVKGIIGAAKIGAASGLGEALGKAESVKEAGEMIATGAVLGSGTGAAFKGLSKGGLFIGKKVADVSKFLKLDKASTKVMSTVSGVAEKNIEVYKNKTREIDKIISTYGDDFTDAADIAREKISLSIKNTRQQLGREISKTLEAASNEPIVDTKPILAKIYEVAKNIDPQLQEAEFAQITELISKVGAKGDKVTLNELFKIKEFLQDRAKGAFFVDGKHIFQPGTKAALAAQKGLFVAKEALNEVAPTIKQANTQLSRLHALEGQLNKNLIAAGKPEAAFMAAGAGINKRNAKVLKKIGDIVDEDVLGKAEEVSAARAFANPSLAFGGGAEKTGFFATRALSGGALGAGAAWLLGEDKSTGFLIGAALTSPFALKKAIQAENIGKDAIRKTLLRLNDPKFVSAASRSVSQYGLDINGLRKRLEKELRAAK